MHAPSLAETVEYGNPIVTSIQQDPHTARKTFSSRRELSDLIACVVRVMRGAGYGNADVLAVSLALREASRMAVAEGRPQGCRPVARVWWSVTSAAVALVVEAEPLAVDSAPAGATRLRDRLERSSSGGLLAIKACMTWVLPHRGNCIAMGRNRTP